MLSQATFNPQILNSTKAQGVVVDFDPLCLFKSGSNECVQVFFGFFFVFFFVCVKLGLVDVKEFACIVCVCECECVCACVRARARISVFPLNSNLNSNPGICSKSNSGIPDKSVPEAAFRDQGPREHTRQDRSCQTRSGLLVLFRLHVRGTRIYFFRLSDSG